MIKINGIETVLLVIYNIFNLSLVVTCKDHFMLYIYYIITKPCLHMQSRGLQIAVIILCVYLCILQNYMNIYW